MDQINSTKMKEEVDKEKDLLSQTKQLSDGSYGKIFMRNPRNDTENFTYDCYLCGVASLPDENALKTHAIEKRHQLRLEMTYIPDATSFRAQFLIEPKNEDFTKSSTKIEMPSTSGSSLMPEIKEFSELSKKKFESPYKFEMFLIMCNLATHTINKKYQEFHRNPKTHPDSSNEWKIFCHKRYKELTVEGKFYENYDYKPEWIEFWMPRMQELKQKEIVNAIKKIATKLDLTSAEFTKFKDKICCSSSEVKKTRSQVNQVELNSRHQRSTKSPIPISSSDDDDDMSRDQNNRRSRVRIVFTSQESRNHCKNQNRSRSPRSQSPFLPFLHTIRLLSSLEKELDTDDLKQVLILLEKAVKMERKDLNSSENLLYDATNLIFLETIMNRLKLKINSVLVDPQRLPAIKKAVKKIATLLPQSSELVPSLEITETVEEASLDADEATNLKIANDLSKTLVEQDRTDVSPEELIEIFKENLKL